MSTIHLFTRLIICRHILKFEKFSSDRIFASNNSKGCLNESPSLPDNSYITDRMTTCFSFDLQAHLYKFSIFRAIKNSLKNLI
jgi:hypothetical protein